MVVMVVAVVEYCQLVHGSPELCRIFGQVPDVISTHLSSQHVHEERIRDTNDTAWHASMPGAYGFFLRTVPSGVHVLRYETVVIDGVWSSYGPTPSSLREAYNAEGSLLAALGAAVGGFLIFCALLACACFPPLWPFVLMAYAVPGGSFIASSQGGLNAPQNARRSVEAAMAPQVQLWNAMVADRANGWQVALWSNQSSFSWSKSEQTCMWLLLAQHETRIGPLSYDIGRVDTFRERSQFRHIENVRPSLSPSLSVAGIETWDQVLDFWMRAQPIVAKEWIDYDVQTHCTKHMPDGGILRRHPPDSRKI